MWVAAGIMAALLALLALLLFVPIRLRAVATHEGGYFRGSWLLGGFQYELPEKRGVITLYPWTFRLRKSKEKHGKEEEEKEAAEKKSKEKSKCRRPRFSSTLLKRVVTGLRRILRRFLRTIRFRKLSVSGSLATPDPALTGMLYGLVPALQETVRATGASVILDVVPDFVNERPRGDVNAEFTTRLFDWALFIICIVRCLTLKETIRMFRKGKNRR
jgi:hypothetical protein